METGSQNMFCRGWDHLNIHFQRVHITTYALIPKLICSTAGRGIMKILAHCRCTIIHNIHNMSLWILGHGYIFTEKKYPFQARNCTYTHTVCDIRVQLNMVEDDGLKYFSVQIMNLTVLDYRIGSTTVVVNISTTLQPVMYSYSQNISLHTSHQGQGYKRVKQMMFWTSTKYRSHLQYRAKYSHLSVGWVHPVVLCVSSVLKS